MCVSERWKKAIECQGSFLKCQNLTPIVIGGVYIGPTTKTSAHAKWNESMKFLGAA